MYNLLITENFECWYVTENSIDNIITLEEAIMVFIGECNKIAEDKNITNELNSFIIENFGDNEDDWLEDNPDEYSKGFKVALCKDEEEVISKYYDYEFLTKTIKTDSKIEFDLSSLDEDELKLITDSGCLGM